MTLTGRFKAAGKHVGSLLAETAREWLADKATTYAGDLSYRILLALSPLVVIAAGVVGLIYQDSDALDGLIARAGDFLGEASADALRVVLDNMTRPGASFLAVFVGGLILLYTAGGAFRALRKALNAIWNVEPAPLRADARRILTFIANQLVMLGLVLVLALGLAALLALSAGWSWLTDWASSGLPRSAFLNRTAEFGFTLVITTVIFAGLFSTVPQGRLPQRYVWLSALVTALLFYIGRLGFSVYIGYSGKASAYGVAGTLVVFLIWVYYSSMIVFFGAELAQVWARRRGDHVVPRKGARSADGFHGIGGKRERDPAEEAGEKSGPEPALSAQGEDAKPPRRADLEATEGGAGGRPSDTDAAGTR